MYYRRRTPGNSAVLYLIAANVIVYILEMVMYDQLITYFALIPILVTKKYFLWQIVTHMFMHGGIWHLFFNMFALFIFGMPLESYWGTEKFLKYYFVAGLGGGLLHYIISPMSPIPSIGASGAVYGLLLAYGLSFPEDVLYINFFIPVKAKYAVFIFGGIELFMGLTGRGSGIAHFAHLGGLVTGLIYLKADRIFARKQKKAGNFKVFRNRPDRPSANPSEKGRFNELLDKISDEGYEALSEKEKTELDILAQKMYKNE